MRFFVHAPTNGVPPLGAVLTPSMTRTYAGWSSRGQIYGQPGTQAIPAPNPAAIMDTPMALANTGDSRSFDSPPFWYPSIYYEAAPPEQKEKFPASVFSDNQMPVPAVRAPNVIEFSNYKARKGGQRQVYQPQVVQTWRGMKGTANG